MAYLVISDSSRSVRLFCAVKRIPVICMLRIKLQRSEEAMVCEHEQLMLATTHTTTAELFIPFFYTDAMLFGISLNQRLYSWVGVWVSIIWKKPLLLLSKDSHPAKIHIKIHLPITGLQCTWFCSLSAVWGYTVLYHPSECRVRLHSLGQTCTLWPLLLV